MSEKLCCVYPENEDERVESVRQLDLLYTPAEERFDRYVRLACRLLGAPVAMVSLMERDVQWFKAAQGHMVNESPRAESFCQYTIKQGEVLLVADALTDSRFFDLPAVFDLGIRFYVGAPLFGPDGQIVGTLCVLDFEPRHELTVDTSPIEDLALCAQAELRLLGMLESERALLSEMDELRRKVSIDEVTRCWNEDVGVEILEREKDKFKPDGRSALAVLMVNVGGLAELNKELGPDATNLYLRLTTEKIRRALPSECSLARLQGANFMAILPSYSVDLGVQYLERTIQNLCTKTCAVGKSQIPLRLRGGLSLFNGAMCETRELIKRAHSAMESAKDGEAGTVKLGI